VHGNRRDGGDQAALRSGGGRAPQRDPAVAEGHDAIREEIKRFREEVREEFKEVKAIIKFSYAELDRRITTVEGEVGSLKGRVERLERGR